MRFCSIPILGTTSWGIQKSFPFSTKAGPTVELYIRFSYWLVAYVVYVRSQNIMGTAAPGESGTRKSPKKLPTWLWISVLGQIGWDGMLDSVEYSTKQKLASIVSREVVFSAHDMYIDPEIARLVVEGPPSRHGSFTETVGSKSAKFKSPRFSLG